MSDSSASLKRKIRSAGDLQSVVRTMRDLAVSNMSQYEWALVALGDYRRVVELGLGACFRGSEAFGVSGVVQDKIKEAGIAVVVFGSDQGLVGSFNERVAAFARETLADLPGNPKVS
jgi:F-type H+-transporting ATPase subunit gamma